MTFRALGDIISNSIVYEIKDGKIYKAEQRN